MRRELCRGGGRLAVPLRTAAPSPARYGSSHVGTSSHHRMGRRRQAGGLPQAALHARASLELRRRRHPRGVGVAVASYRDEAVGVMAKTPAGVAWISKVTLSPQISYAGDKQPTADELARLHHAAHDSCFIASSVKTEIVVA